MSHAMEPELVARDAGEQVNVQHVAAQVMELVINLVVVAVVPVEAHVQVVVVMDQGFALVVAVMDILHQTGIIVATVLAQAQCLVKLHVALVRGTKVAM